MAAGALLQDEDDRVLPKPGKTGHGEQMDYKPLTK